MKSDAGFAAARRRGLELPPRLPVDEWSEQHRVIVVGAEPGPWRNPRTPYLVEPMRCLTDHRVRDVVLMAASQVGKTEVGINWFLRNIDCDPSYLLWVTSTEKQLKKVSRGRFDPALSEARFAGRVSPKKGRDADRTTYSVAFENGRLCYGTSHSPSDLSSDPQKFVTYDEVDRYDLSSQDEGDVIDLGRARQSTFELNGARSLYISSPGIAGMSRIAQLYEESDRRRYFVRCHACAHAQHLVFEQVKFPAGPTSAYYECERCKARWTDAQRWAALQPDAGAEWVAEQPFKGSAGFHLSQLYSTFVGLTTLADRWIKSEGKIEQRQVFFNTVLGLTWSVDAEAVDADTLPREDWTGYDFPLDACLLVAFVDVQGNRLECSTYAVSPDESLYGVHHEVLVGQVSQREVWEALAQHLERSWRRQDGREFRVAATGVDCGFEADRVIKWCAARSAQGKIAYAIKGFAEGFRGPIVAKRTPSRARAGGFFYAANTDASKYQVLQRLKAEGAFERLRFPKRDCFSDDFFEQLTSEKLVWRPRRGGLSVLEWHRKPGVRNEALDCAAGALGVLRWLNPNLRALAAKVPTLTEPAAPLAAGGATPAKVAPARRGPTVTVAHSGTMFDR